MVWFVGLNVICHFIFCFFLFLKMFSCAFGITDTILLLWRNVYVFVRSLFFFRAPNQIRLSESKFSKIFRIWNNNNRRNKKKRIKILHRNWNRISVHLLLFSSFFFLLLFRLVVLVGFCVIWMWRAFDYFYSDFNMEISFYCGIELNQPKMRWLCGSHSSK